MRTWRVLGALGPGLHAPVLAEQRWGPRTRRVVLCRPAPDETAPLSGAGFGRVVGEEDRVLLEGRELAVVRYVPRIDVGALLDQHPDGLPAAALAELAVGIRDALGEAPVPHGDLGPSAVRLGPEVALVGFRGRGTDDLDTLRDLIEAWGELPDGLLDALLRGDPVPAQLEGPPLSELVGAVGDPPLTDHPWRGRDLQEASAPSIPPKARTAAIAGITLVLGLLSGLLLGGG